MYQRYGVLPLEFVMPRLTGQIEKKSDERVQYDSVKFHVSGLRLATFKHKGLRCVKCGIEGKYFAIERNGVHAADSPIYHINLYAVDAEGKEVMMTHDHILARSLGGRPNSLDNTQTMCSTCNFEKSVFERREAQRLRQVSKATGVPLPKGLKVGRNTKKNAARKARRKKIAALKNAAASLGVERVDPATISV